jgi:hypothetical protein
MEQIGFSVVVDDGDHFVIRNADGHEFIFGTIEWDNKRDELVGTARWNGTKPPNNDELMEAAFAFTRLRSPWCQLYSVQY